MKKKLKISEFASITGLSRKTLIFYDKIKLLFPDKIDDNKYRYYSFGQIDTAVIVKTLCEMGIPLKEVKEYLNKRSPEHFIQLMEKRKVLIDQEISRLERIREIINHRLELTHRGNHIESGTIIYKHCPKEYLFMGSEIPHSESLEDAWRYLNEFHEICQKQQLEFGRPIGVVINNEFLTRKGYHPLSHYYYTLHQEDSRFNFVKPAGMYVIGYEYTSYGQTDNIYGRIKKYINEHGLQICSPIYTEYILDEVIMQNASNYLAQVTIQVNQKVGNDSGKAAF